MKIHLTLVIAFLIAACASIGSSVAASDRRVALVIGNSDYDHVPSLPNPANDAEDISAALERIGFEVTRGQDLGHREMRLALRDFAEAADNAEMVVVYFAGHGIEIDKTNYLIPVNAELRSDRDVEFEAIRLDAIVNAVAGVEGLKVILIDACRNNPFLTDMARTSATRSIGRGLGRIDPGGFLVGYAARGGTLALDGEGRNSPYAEAVLSHIEEPGLEIGRMFRKIRSSVLEATAGYQEPFTYGSLPDEDIFLVPAVAAVSPPVSVPVDIQGLIEAFERADRLDTILNWEQFLQEFGQSHPKNRLVALARTKRAALNAQINSRSARGNWLEARYDAAGTAQLTREQVAMVQRSLSYSGVDPGPVDGALGPRTLRAISLARARAGLPNGPRIDSALVRWLVDPNPVDDLRSESARKFVSSRMPAGLEPRLKKAIDALEGLDFLFDYYEGRLYIALLNSNAGRQLNWQLAGQLAEAAGGHLATIGSAEENAFIRDLYATEPRFLMRRDGGVSGPVFGLFQLEGAVEPRGGWTWVTAETLEYTNWARGEPNNGRGVERHGKFHASGNVRTAPKTWADGVAGNARDGDKLPGFILEIE